MKSANGPLQLYVKNRRLAGVRLYPRSAEYAAVDIKMRVIHRHDLFRRHLIIPGIGRINGNFAPHGRQADLAGSHTML